MTTLRTAAQQALEALRCVDLQSLVPDYGSGHYSVARLDGPQVKSAITALRAALAEPNRAQKMRDAGYTRRPTLREMAEQEPLGQASTDVPLTVYVVKKAEPVQEPVAYSVGRTLHWHEGKGVNDAQLYLAPPQRPAEPVQEPYDQTALELCNVCGWKTLIPGDCCLNCVRKHPLGQASTDVPLTVYSVKKAKPVERKPMNEFDALRLITESIGRLQSAGPVEGLIGIIRAVERAHGIT